MLCQLLTATLDVSQVSLGKFYLDELTELLLSLQKYFQRYDWRESWSSPLTSAAFHKLSSQAAT